nr:hypothetical protein OH837_07515 [Streptomyces canus]
MQPREEGVLGEEGGHALRLVGVDTGLARVRTPLRIVLCGTIRRTWPVGRSAGWATASRCPACRSWYCGPPPTGAPPGGPPPHRPRLAFIGVSSLALATGAHLRFPRSVVLPTAGYSVGQILGPLVVAPLLHHGYHRALLPAALVVLVAAAAAAVLRIGLPHHMVVRGHTVPEQQRESTEDARPTAAGP